eukprot:scaffold19_cov169-Amphora_coffeaeformis.AAC.2
MVKRKSKGPDRDIFILELTGTDLTTGQANSSSPEKKRTGLGRLLARASTDASAVVSPFVQVSTTTPHRSGSGAEQVIIGRSKVLTHQSDPQWPAIHLDYHKHIRQADQPLEISVYTVDHTNADSAVLLASVLTTARECIDKATVLQSTDLRNYKPAQLKKRSAPCFTLMGGKYGDAVVGHLHVKKAALAVGQPDVVEGNNDGAAVSDDGDAASAVTTPQSNTTSPTKRGGFFGSGGRKQKTTTPEAPAPAAAANESEDDDDSDNVENYDSDVVDTYKLHATEDENDEKSSEPKEKEDLAPEHEAWAQAKAMQRERLEQAKRSVREAQAARLAAATSTFNSKSSSSTPTTPPGPPPASWDAAGLAEAAAQQQQSQQDNSPAAHQQELDRQAKLNAAKERAQKAQAQRIANLEAAQQRQEAEQKAELEAKAKKEQEEQAKIQAEQEEEKTKSQEEEDAKRQKEQDSKSRLRELTRRREERAKAQAEKERTAKEAEDAKRKEQEEQVRLIVERAKARRLAQEQEKTKEAATEAQRSAEEEGIAKEREADRQMEEAEEQRAAKEDEADESKELSAEEETRELQKEIKAMRLAVQAKERAREEEEENASKDKELSVEEEEARELLKEVEAMRLAVHAKETSREEESQRKQSEEDERRTMQWAKEAEEEEAKRLAAEEEAMKIAAEKEDEEARRFAEEEAARQVAVEAEVERLAEEAYLKEEQVDPTRLSDDDAEELRRWDEEADAESTEQVDASTPGYADDDISDLDELDELDALLADDIDFGAIVSSTPLAKKIPSPALKKVSPRVIPTPKRRSPRTQTRESLGNSGSKPARRSVSPSAKSTESSVRTPSSLWSSRPYKMSPRELEAKEKAEQRLLSARHRGVSQSPSPTKPYEYEDPMEALLDRPERSEDADVFTRLYRNDIPAYMVKRVNRHYYDSSSP